MYGYRIQDVAEMCRSFIFDPNLSVKAGSILHQSLLIGYHGQRDLSDAEVAAIPLFCQATEAWGFNFLHDSVSAAELKGELANLDKVDTWFRQSRPE
jgi:Ser/Thr protein kinase RdoA (MazF antagonist)